MMRALYRGAISVSVIALAAAGPSFAQRPNCDEATVLGLEISGELVAPASVVNQVTEDLAIIRDAYPVVAGIAARRDWYPGMLIVGLTAGAWAQHLAGTYAALDALNDEYGMVVVGQLEFINTLVLASRECSHPMVLDEAYSSLAGVEYAHPDWILGDGASDDITCTYLGWYTFQHAYMSYNGGRPCFHYWIFSVIDGAARLTTEYGDPLSGVGDSDHTAGIKLRQNRPNPFNPATSVSFGLGEAAFVSIDVYDLAGRLVCALFAGDMSAGNHEILWRGQDSRGNAVASGVYVCKIRAGASVDSIKMLLAD